MLWGCACPAEEHLLLVTRSMVIVVRQVRESSVRTNARALLASRSISPLNIKCSLVPPPRGVGNRVSSVASSSSESEFFAIGFAVDNFASSLRKQRPEKAMRSTRVL